MKKESSVFFEWSKEESKGVIQLSMGAEAKKPAPLPSHLGKLKG